MKNARSAFWPGLVLANILMLSIATGCEAREQRPAQAPPDAPVSIAALRPVEGPAPTGPIQGSPESVADLVEAVKQTVVNVEVQARTQAPAIPRGDIPEDLFERFFGDQFPGGHPDMPGRVQQGQGSGFIIDPSGLLLTNNHVVENAIIIRVTLEDGRQFEARVLGRDPLTDLALLQIKDEVRDLPYAVLGDSDAVRVGDWVLAIGNPFGLASSVSTGILSARARDIQAGPYDNFLQTDAAINPGNSGGPLFNMQGQVIGINTAIVGGGTGIGFAVPSNMARQLLPQLQQGEIRRGWLGVSVQDLTPELAQALGVRASRGAIVSDVQPETPAQRAGLQADDVIVALDGEPVESARGLTRAIGFRKPEEQVRLTLLRDGRQRQLQVQLGERPDIEGLAQETPPPEEDLETGKLGLGLQPVDPRRVPGVTQGALVTFVQPGSPADRAELQPGMVIIEAGGKPVRHPRDVARIVRGAKSGEVLLLRIQMPEGGRLLRALRVP
jgi:serine protease Do